MPCCVTSTASWMQSVPSGIRAIPFHPRGNSRGSRSLDDMAGPRETILIHGGRVYDHDGDTDNPPQADVLLRDGMVAEVAPGLLARHQAGGVGGVDRVI